VALRLLPTVFCPEIFCSRNIQKNDNSIKFTAPICLISLILEFFAISAFAQGSIPEWVDESWRSIHYPKSEWYTGFATDKVANGQPDSKTYQSVEKDAQSKLSESIVVTVQASSALQTSVRQETTSTNYDQSIRTASNAVLAKVDVKSYFDKKSGYIYGFAAVKKKDLADFYRSGINSLFSFAEKEFALAEQQAEQGKKKAALGRIQAIEDSLKNVAYWGSLLQAVASDNSYIGQEKALWQRAGAMKMQLQGGTSVYLDISGDNGLENLGAEMQEKGCNCSIAETKEDADYAITVKTKLSRCNKADFGQVYCWANASVSVFNSKTKKSANLKIPEAKGGWTEGNTEKATEESFKNLTENLVQQLIKEMEK